MFAVTAESGKNQPTDSPRSAPDAHASILQESLLLDRVVDLLIQQAKTCSYWADLFRHAGRILASQPLATHDFDLAQMRLSNAEDYADRGEHGACLFELRQLRHQLVGLP